MLGRVWHNYDKPPSAREVRMVAFHEAVELLFASYRDLACNRFASPDALYEEKHRIIQVLTNVFFLRWDEEKHGEENS